MGRWTAAAILFATDRDGNCDLWTVNVSTDVQSPVVQLADDQRDPAVAPTGRSSRTRPAARATPTSGCRPRTGASPTPAHDRRGLRTAARLVAVGARIAFSSTRKNRPEDLDDDRGRRRRERRHRRPAPATSTRRGRTRRRARPTAPRRDPPRHRQRSPAGPHPVKLHGHSHLGFDSAVRQRRTGPLWIRGSRPNRTVKEMRADQLVELQKPASVRRYKNDRSLHYEPHQPHYHWHLQPFERYEPAPRIRLRDARPRPQERLLPRRPLRWCLGPRQGRGPAALPRQLRHGPDTRAARRTGLVDRLHGPLSGALPRSGRPADGRSGRTLRDRPPSNPER